MGYQDFLREIQGNPFRGLMDGEMGTQISEASAPCAALLHEILGGISGAGTLGLEEAARNLSDGGNSICVNTFPYGIKTHSTFPDYIGIACTATSMKKVLDSAERHCWNMERQFGDEIDKTVIILTDKWNHVQFERDYERIFLRYALRDRVLFMFFMVNNHGVSHIPFLTWNRRKLERLANNYQQMGGFEDEKSLDLLLKYRECEYEMITDSDEGTIYTTYEFDFLHRIYRKEISGTHPDISSNLEGKHDRSGSKSGEIDIPAMLDFAAAAYELSQLPQEAYAEVPPFIETESKGMRFRLRIFDKTFCWGAGFGEFEKIREAVGRFVNAL